MRSFGKRGAFVLGPILLLGMACHERAPAPPPPSQAPPALRPLTAHGDAPEHSTPDGLPAEAGTGVSGTVTLDPQFRDRARPGGILFLIARSADTHQILAVRREQGVQFPFAFHISGADAMMAGTSFAGKVDLTARLSKSGEALPSPGDLEGVARGLSSSAQGVVLTLDTLRS